MLRIGIDGRAFSSPAGGVRRYVEGLVPALQALPGLELVALGGSAAPAGLERVAEPMHPPTNLGWAAVGLPRAAARARVDIIHAPAYTGPLWSRVPVVLTIHDVSYARHPEWYPYRQDRLRRAFYRRSAEAAAHIVTDSAFSAAEIVAAYGIARDRITVAPLGVVPTFAPSHPDTRPSENPSTQAPKNPSNQNPGTQAPEHPRTVLPSSPYVLHVGDLHPRRNLAMVTTAVIAARGRLGMPLALVLAGVDRGVGADLARQAAAAGAPDALVRQGVVDEAGLRELYAGAAALVYPSRYEGFGLPVLEAMASGTPVIASRAGSIPEVLGDAGTLLDPDDEPGWTTAIQSVASDAGLRARMRAHGIARASEFTWARTARITAHVYRAVSERR